jgi:hypothetical protein
MFFLCEIKNGSRHTNLEIEDINFFNIDSLPELSIRRVTEGQIKRMNKLRTNPLTDFD